MHISDMQHLARERGGEGFWYLATPYTNYPAGHELAYRDASYVAALLLTLDIPNFCPIAHSHPIAIHGHMDKTDHTVWLPLDRHMMDAAVGVIVAKLDGWAESYGVNHEIEVFTKAGKPILFLTIDKDMPLPSRSEDAMLAGFRWPEPTLSDKEDEFLRGSQWTPKQIERMKCRQMSQRVARVMSSEERKQHPIATGVFDYFPDALMGVARISYLGNEKHNPGQPLHHARGKSTDHADSMLRHFKDRGMYDDEIGADHSAEMCWRALALYQQELEDRGEAPLARGAKLPDTVGVDPATPGSDHTVMVVMGGNRRFGKTAETEESLKRHMSAKAMLDPTSVTDGKQTWPGKEDPNTEAQADIEGRKSTLDRVRPMFGG